MRRTSPPRLARALLRLLPPHLRDTVREELDEEYDARLQAGSRRSCRRWYWAYAVRSVLDAWLISMRPRGIRERRRRTITSDSWWSDVRHGLRLLVREPMVSAAMIGTMVLGIGVLTAVGSLVYGVLIRPLPFPDSGQIVQIARTDGVTAPDFAVVGLPDLLDWEARSSALSHVAGWSSASATMVVGEEAVRIGLTEVTAGLPGVLGITPELGRLFAAEEYTPEGSSVLVLSHGFFRRAFGGDPNTVGRTVLLDNRSYTVLGVLPERPLDYPDDGHEAWVPLVRDPAHWSMNVRGASWLNAVGRIATGTSLEVAEAEMTRIQEALVREAPRTQEGQVAIALTPLRDVLGGPARQTLTLLSVSVLAILAIACLNLTVLVLARATRRTSEFSVRSALGGTRERLRRQLFAESLVVTTLGGVLGLAAAPAMLRAIVSLYPGGLPRANELGIDWLMLVVTSVAIAASAMGAGLVPSVRVLGERPSAGRTRGRTGEGARARSVLAGIQIAVSVVLLIGSALLIETLSGLGSVDPGFEPEGATAFQVLPSQARYPNGAALDRYYDDLLERLTESPSIAAAGLSTFAPFTSGDWGHGFDVVGEGSTEDAPTQPASVRITRDGYYAALGVGLVRGRVFEAIDDAASAPVAMLNATAARSAFGPTEAVGRHIVFEGTVREVVGVVDDVKHRSLAESPAPEVHLPARQMPPRSAWIVVRAQPRAANDVTADIRAAVRSVDPTIAIVGMASYEARLSDVLGPERFRATLVSGLGALAVVIAMIGIYGTLSNLVSRMIGEIGVRMALGESRSSVVHRVLRRAMALAGLGVGIGLAAAVALSSRVDAFLYGVDRVDPTTYFLVAAAVWSVCVIAALGPAWRASRCDPVAIIREEG